MKEILDFLKDFNESEFNSLLAKYNLTISDDDYIKYQNSTETFFHSILNPDLHRPMNINDVISSDKWSKRYARTRSKLLKRKIFSIREFSNFEVGLQLDIITGTKLFRADLSYYQDTPLEFSSISDAYYITQTNEGLKIIYRKNFIWDKGEWEHSHNNQGKQVINEGIQVAIERIEAPIDPISLKEFNK